MLEHVLLLSREQLHDNLLIVLRSKILALRKGLHFEHGIDSRQPSPLYSTQLACIYMYALKIETKVRDVVVFLVTCFANEVDVQLFKDCEGLVTASYSTMCQILDKLAAIASVAGILGRPGCFRRR